MADIDSAATETPRASRRLRPLRLRYRAGAVGLAVAMVVISGIVLDRHVGVRPIGAVSLHARPTGAWFCPHGGGPGWKGWVVVANPGNVPATVRLTTFGSDGVQGTASFGVPAGHQVYRSVPATEAGSSTEVDYFGEWIGAAAVVEAAGSPAGVGAERCVTAPHQRWFVPDGTTGRGESASLVVMNPFGEDAAFDVTIRTEERSISPGKLSPALVPAGASVAIALNQYALEGPREHTVSAEVTAELGRVVVGGVGISPSGLREEAGETMAAGQWILPAAGYGGQSEVAGVNPGVRPADLTMIGQGASTARVVGLGNLVLQPDRAGTFEVTGLQGVGTLVQSTSREPIAVARRLEGVKGDTATITGASRPAPAWLVLPTTPPEGGSSMVVLENAGRTTARLRLQLLGGRGPVSAAGISSITVPAGRTVAVSLTSRTGSGPVSVVIRASAGTIVAGEASYSLGGDGYSATLGLPISGLG